MSVLRQSRLRVDRAQEKLTLLEGIIEGARKAALKTAAEQADPYTGSKPLEEFTRPLVDEVRLLTSEFALHARTALDYVVFAVARRDTGAEQKNTQFPINESPEKFAENRTGSLKHLTAEHIAMVESFQPYKRFRLQPLLLLHKLSNRDKHRKLAHISFQSSSRQDPNFQTRPPSIGITHMEVSPGRSFEVLLYEDGLEIKDLSKALTDILSQVSEIVDYFDKILD
jgi:hypothetical protein